MVNLMLSCCPSAGSTRALSLLVFFSYYKTSIQSQNFELKLGSHCISPFFFLFLIEVNAIATAALSNSTSKNIIQKNSTSESSSKLLRCTPQIIIPHDPWFPGLSGACSWMKILCGGAAPPLPCDTAQILGTCLRGLIS